MGPQAGHSVHQILQMGKGGAAGGQVTRQGPVARYYT